VGPDSLQCTAPGARYAWFLDGQPLPQTTQTIRAERTGDYTVSATLGNCPPERSVAFRFAPTAVVPVAPAGTLRVYPNPGQGLVHVELATAPGDAFHLTLLTVTGVPTLHKKVQPGGTSPHRETLAVPRPGVYLLKVATAHKVWIRKVVIE
jgi:hypothetical protein